MTKIHANHGELWQTGFRLELNRSQTIFLFVNQWFTIILTANSNPPTFGVQPLCVLWKHTMNGNCLIKAPCIWWRAMSLWGQVKYDETASILGRRNAWCRTDFRIKYQRCKREEEERKNLKGIRRTMAYFVNLACCIVILLCIRAEKFAFIRLLYTYMLLLMFERDTHCSCGHFDLCLTYVGLPVQPSQPWL